MVLVKMKLDMDMKVACETSSRSRDGGRRARELAAGGLERWRQVGLRRMVGKAFIPTTAFQRALLAAGSAVTALANPSRADAVATLGEVTSGYALVHMRNRMRTSEEGRRILEERPLITSKTLDVSSLLTLPPRTLGRAYADFMDHHGFDADMRPEVRFIEDEELAYVMTRYRQTHDFWHVLTGLPPTELGEVALKGIEFAELGLPMCALSAAFGPLRLSNFERLIIFNDFLPWAREYATNRSKDSPLAVRFEDHLETPLRDIQLRCGFDAVPVLPSDL